MTILRSPPFAVIPVNHVYTEPLAHRNFFSLFLAEQIHEFKPLGFLTAPVHYVILPLHSISVILQSRTLPPVR